MLLILEKEQKNDRRINFKILNIFFPYTIFMGFFKYNLINPEYKTLEKLQKYLIMIFPKSNIK